MSPSDKPFEGLPVRGYQPQSGRAVDLVNRNKVLEEMVLRRIDGLAGDADIDLRWLRIGQTHLELAFMALNRAIFQPQRLSSNDAEEPVGAEPPQAA